jgi:hypothetical protein
LEAGDDKNRGELKLGKGGVGSTSPKGLGSKALRASHGASRRAAALRAAARGGEPALAGECARPAAAGRAPGTVECDASVCVRTIG